MKNYEGGDCKMTTFSVGSVTLPKNPKDVAYKRACNLSEIPYNIAQLPLVVSMGHKCDVMTWEGVLYEDGQDNAYLHTQYLTQLLALCKTLVTLTVDGRTLYSGDWVFGEFEFKEIHGRVTTIPYKMTFVKPSAFIQAL